MKTIKKLISTLKRIKSLLNFYTVKKQGFSLVELLVVVAIIGILAAVAIPTYIVYTTRTKQAIDASALNAIVRLINLAEQTGVKATLSDLGTIRIKGERLDDRSSSVGNYLWIAGSRWTIPLDHQGQVWCISIIIPVGTGTTSCVDSAGTMVLGGTGSSVYAGNYQTSTCTSTGECG